MKKLPALEKEKASDKSPTYENQKDKSIARKSVGVKKITTLSTLVFIEVLDDLHVFFNIATDMQHRPKSTMLTSVIQKRHHHRHLCQMRNMIKSGLPVQGFAACAFGRYHE